MINTAPNHKHTYDEQGRMTCCTLEEKIYTEAGAEQLLHKKKTIDSGQDKVQLQAHSSVWKQYLPAIISFVMLLIGIALDNYFKPSFFTNYVRLAWYAIAYLPVGLPVIKEGWEASLKKEFFTEFTLMVLATMGAFAIGQYPEGVAVMLFYAVGELFQKAAVNKAKNNIKALLDVRPSSASVLRNNKYEEIKPEEVEIGETIQIKAGEKIPLDGEMLSEGSSFNTAALTGESKPKSIYKGAQVLAGMLNLDKVIELKVTKKFADSSLARILEMVQNATARKAKTELLIRKFAKIYTPIVFFLAVALVVVPYFVLSNYVFNDWLYRALIFLVISCPCALVISIPLGYFGGIGAASRNGILFKGSNYLELMTKINTVVMDKTGTLTAGVFKVQAIVTNGMDKTDFIKTLAALESKSTHPIAKAIAEYEKNETQTYQATEIEEISGHGLKGNVNGKEVLAGNTKLLKKYNITYDAAIDEIIESIVLVAIGNQYTGYVLIADEVKEDAKEAIRQMHLNGIKQTIMLSGDKNSITQKVAKQIGIDTAFGDLLPENKVQKVEELKQEKTKIIAFVGDGINDAPVLALSDVGIAMGAMGSDAAIETANVVIQTDQPLKIVTAIKIGKATRGIVIQNIILAFAVKAIVLVLGAGGLATMWEAVFADVGVALLAILNAVRIQRMKF
ncbi:heavy metal translocating P-type ATPase [Aquirufa antheringensis]|uniref:heavy metal translocating P-type ATPase n=1 Tax=Aquirufa antheringensis TaxID=2516559 RepID=UPI0022A82A4B|nr:heavy metal translocating P-type ATPase [Aquirufa antheringensis]MCZ2487137.1 cadmium-translocating P-type ATPase [Aquirufa antheringensis]MCZ2489881.1 cadmium-translocating P-type ATPase [Aquirufa antheringensis]